MYILRFLYSLNYSQKFVIQLIHMPLIFLLECNISCFPGLNFICQDPAHSAIDSTSCWSPLLTASQFSTFIIYMFSAVFHVASFTLNSRSSTTSLNIFRKPSVWVLAPGVHHWPHSFSLREKNSLFSAIQLFFQTCCSFYSYFLWRWRRPFSPSSCFSEQSHQLCPWGSIPPSISL